MFKGTVLYRRMWYAKRRNMKSLYIAVKLAAIFIILALMLFYAEKRVNPYIIDASDSMVRRELERLADHALHSEVEGGASYEKLVMVETQPDGQSWAVKLNEETAGRIAAASASYIREKLELEVSKLAVPLGAFLGAGDFRNTGPGIHVGIRYCSEVQASMNSQILKVQGSSAKHVIIMQLRVKIAAGLPFMEKRYWISVNVPVAQSAVDYGKTVLSSK